MKNLFRFSIIFMMFWLLSACQETDLTLNGSHNASIVFPKQNAITVLDKITIRLTATEGVSKLQVNGVDTHPNKLPNTSISTGNGSCCVW